MTFLSNCLFFDVLSGKLLFHAWLTIIDNDIFWCNMYIYYLKYTFELVNSYNGTENLWFLWFRTLNQRSKKTLTFRRV